MMAPLMARLKYRLRRSADWVEGGDNSIAIVSL
jgi:hypothetical protein